MLDTAYLSPNNQIIEDYDELAKNLFSFIKVKAKVIPLYYQENGELKFRFHKYQKRAMRAKERFILLLGGTQSGKTSFGPIWLEREIRLRGPGDYLAVAPSYPLMNKKMLPEFIKYFQTTLNLGHYLKAERVFKISPIGEILLFGRKQKEPTQIFFGHSQDPDALESATAKGAWLDEAGQSKFKLFSYEAIVRRLSLHMGRILLTTTPYNLGWLKQLFWDVWQKGKAKAESIKIINFPSIANPSFPKEEYERARNSLPKWKFDMFYRGIFSRPIGLIYDCFDTAFHKIKDFVIPSNWYKYAGLDFGGVNMVALKIAEDPETKNLYVFGEYKKGNLTAKEHAIGIRAGEDIRYAYGGAKSEDQWRLEFGSGGFPVHKNFISDVEIGINHVYAALKNKKLYIFESCVNLLDELGSYSRVLNEAGEPTEEIAEKSTYHFLDALRYIILGLTGTGKPAGAI